MMKYRLFLLNFLLEKLRRRYYLFLDLGIVSENYIVKIYCKYIRVSLSGVFFSEINYFVGDVLFSKKIVMLM